MLFWRCKLSPYDTQMDSFNTHTDTSCYLCEVQNVESIYGNARQREKYTDLTYIKFSTYLALGQYIFVTNSSSSDQQAPAVLLIFKLMLSTHVITADTDSRSDTVLQIKMLNNLTFGYTFTGLSENIDKAINGRIFRPL